MQPEISSLSGLGDRVTCDIIGDAHTGVAVVMKSRNPFSKKRYGFFIQPEGPEGRIFTFWHGPARQPKKGDWIGADLLDHYKTTEATPDIAAAFALTIEQAAQDRKKTSSNRQ